MSALDAVRRANAKAKPEESVALRAAVLVAILSASLATLAQGVGGPPLRIAATVGIAGGFAYSHWARHRAGYALKAFLAVGVMLAFAQFLHAATGVRTGAFNEVQVPLAELFLWVQFLHSLDVPARRDLLFSLLSSLVLMAVAGVLSLSLNLGVNLIVWAAAAVIALVLAYRSEVRDLPPLTVDVRQSRPPAGRTARTAIAVVALVGLVGGAAFLVVPAAGAGHAVAFPARLPRALAIPTRAGGLSNPSLGRDDPAGDQSAGGRSNKGRASFGYFGFSKELDTAARGRPDDTIVMKVKASRPDFWRGQSFDTWDGRRWTQSHDRPHSVIGDSPLSLTGSDEDRSLGVTQSGEDFIQTVYVTQQGPNLIFAAYAPAQLYFSDRRVFELDDGTVRTGVELFQGAVYTVVSRRPAVTPDILRQAGDRPIPVGAGAEAFLGRYTQLPDDVPARVTELAQSVAGPAPTAYDKVIALEQWMADHTTYTLDIPKLPPGADSVDRYLFVDKQGFCEQIASSLVVMLRSLGIPARIGVGYAAGERNPFTGLWEVRASDAHAWAEVWFPGVGWQAFDPTAHVPFSGQPFSSAAGAGLFRYLGARLSVPGWVGKGAVGLVLVGFPLVAILWALTREVGARRRRRSRAWADVVLERLEAAGAREGRPRRPSETTRQYARALRYSVIPDERLDDVAALLEVDAFSGAPLPDAERVHAERLLDEVLSGH